MSCKNKLSNLPVISKIDDQLKKLTPSKLEGLPSKIKLQTIKQGFSNIAGDIKGQVKTQITNFTNEVTGQLAATGDLVKGLVTDLKAGIPDDLKSIKSSVVTSINSAKSELSKQYNNLKDVLECESEVVSETTESVQETSKLKSTLAKTSSSETKSLSNREIKDIVEEPSIKDDKSSQITNQTIQEGERVAQTSQSNKVVTKTQNNSLSSIQVIPPINNDKFAIDMGDIYTKYIILVPEIQKELDKYTSTLKPYVNDDKLIKCRLLSRALQNTIILNVKNLQRLYNQNQLTLGASQFNLSLNNEQSIIVQLGTQRVQEKVTQEMYTKQLNATIEKRNTLLQSNSGTVVINIIKGGII